VSAPEVDIKDIVKMAMDSIKKDTGATISALNLITIENTILMMARGLVISTKDTRSSCVECTDKLDARMTKRCPKHIGMLMAADFAKAKVREHGPALAAKAVIGLQGWFEKVMTSEEKPDEAT